MQDFIDGLVTTVLIPALLALVAYSVQRVTKAFTEKTGIQVDAVMSAQMHDAIDRYLSAAFAKAGYDPALSKRDPIFVTNVIRGAENYIEKMNPGAYERFGYEKVREAIAKHAGEV